MNRGDEPEAVAGDIEDHHRSAARDFHLVGARKRLAEVGEAFPLSGADNGHPIGERRFGRWVCFCPSFDGLRLNQTHEDKLSSLVSDVNSDGVGRAELEIWGGRYLHIMHSGARPFESEDEVSRFLSAIDGDFKFRDRALVTLGLYAGLRVSSALSLSVHDVYDGRSFRKSIRVARKSMKGRRGSFVIPLHPRAARAIGRWLVTLRRRGESLAPGIPLFRSRQQGRPITTRMAQTMVTNAAVKAGLEAGISTHSWRKTFATRIYDANDHCLITTAAALAHDSADLRSTARYLRFRLSEKANRAVLNL